MHRRPVPPTTPLQPHELLWKTRTSTNTCVVPAETLMVMERGWTLMRWMWRDAGSWAVLMLPAHTQTMYETLPPINVTFWFLQLRLSSYWLSRLSPCFRKWQEIIGSRRGVGSGQLMASSMKECPRDYICPFLQCPEMYTNTTL